MIPRQDVLLPPVERLQTALASPAPGRERDWAGEVDAVLGGVEEALRRHVTDTDAPEGMFTKVDLTRPALVRKGATVLMLLDSPGIALTAQGQALEPGAIGERIRVLNPTSRAVVEAEVIGSGRVRVTPGGLPVTVSVR